MSRKSSSATSNSKHAGTRTGGIIIGGGQGTSTGIGIGIGIGRGRGGSVGVGVSNISRPMSKTEMAALLDQYAAAAYRNYTHSPSSSQLQPSEPSSSLPPRKPLRPLPITFTYSTNPTPVSQSQPSLPVPRPSVDTTTSKSRVPKSHLHQEQEQPPLPPIRKASLKTVKTGVVSAITIKPTASGKKFVPMVSADAHAIRCSDCGKWLDLILAMDHRCDSAKGGAAGRAVAAAAAATQASQSPLSTDKKNKTIPKLQLDTQMGVSDQSQAGSRTQASRYAPLSPISDHTDRDTLDEENLSTRCLSSLASPLSPEPSSARLPFFETYQLKVPPMSAGFLSRNTSFQSNETAKVSSNQSTTTLVSPRGGVPLTQQHLGFRQQSVGRQHSTRRPSPPRPHVPRSLTTTASYLDSSVGRSDNSFSRSTSLDSGHPDETMTTDASSFDDSDDDKDSPLSIKFLLTAERGPESYQDRQASRHRGYYHDDNSHRSTLKASYSTPEKLSSNQKFYHRDRTPPRNISHSRAAFQPTPTGSKQRRPDPNINHPNNKTSTSNAYDDLNFSGLDACLEDLRLMTEDLDGGVSDLEEFFGSKASRREAELESEDAQDGPLLSPIWGGSQIRMRTSQSAPVLCFESSTSLPAGPVVEEINSVPVTTMRYAPLSHNQYSPSKRVRTTARPTCASCRRTSAEVKLTKTGDGQAFCRSCYAERYLPKCRKCQRPIEGTAMTSSDGKITGKYHPNCFSCFRCSSTFQTKECYVFDGRPYCQQHYHELNKSLCTDVQCGLPIEGPCVSLVGEENGGGGRYHVDCFKCAHYTCKIPLLDHHFLVGGIPYCERHSDSRPSGVSVGGSYTRAGDLETRANLKSTSQDARPGGGGDDSTRETRARKRQTIITRRGG